MREQSRPETVPVTTEASGKQTWETPVLEEIEYQETAGGSGIYFDGTAYSGAIVPL